MEFVGLLNPLLSSIQYLHSLIKEETGINVDLKNGLDYVKSELELMQHDMEKYEEQELQELVYDIEDFIDDFSSPRSCSFIHTALGKNPGTEQLTRIEFFMRKIQELRQRHQTQIGEGSGSATSEPPNSGSSPEQAELVGIDEPKDELLRLLLGAEDRQDQARQLRVISIVGCSGLGKSALARAVYDDPAVAHAFHCKAWVSASECKDAEDILEHILRQLRPSPPARGTTSQVNQPREQLREFLQNRRYLVVVDDVVQVEVWEGVEYAFTNDDTAGSRIIVTTSIQRLASSRSPGSYRYTMPCLDVDDSQELLWRKVYGRHTRPAQAMVASSAAILSKCDGLPLALVSVGNHLRQNPTVENCRDVGQALGTYLAGTAQAFRELKKSLLQCYDSLPDHRHKNCLLSVSMFPKGHRIHRKSLVRRWVAEGLIVGDAQRNDEAVALRGFSEFVNRSIIEPVLIGTNSEVKRCLVQGVALEFIVHRSISKNFVTLLHRDEHLPRTRRSPYPVRRLSVHDGTGQSAGFANETDLSAIRWLTIYNSALFDFSKCRLLRVLDLEGCNGFDDNSVLDTISNLLFLKYLSLRGSDVRRIPERIRRLHYLETLDIRETRVGILPMEVIKMPRLAHLFGRFELPPISKGRSHEMEKFFSEKSNLQTLSGVVIDKEDQAFEQIMIHARKLKKVKLWCKNRCPSGQSTPSKNIFPLKKFTGSKALESLSIDSSDLSQYFLSEDFLGSLQGCSLVRFMKLTGALSSLPSSSTLAIKLAMLEELQLFSTGLSSENLSILQSLPCLMYLKLSEERREFGEGCFVVGEDGFDSLQRLCFEAPKLPRVQFEQGSMCSLASLHLLCPESSSTVYFCRSFQMPTATAEIEYRLGVEGLSHLVNLNEVVLHHATTDANMQVWKEATNRHINRPFVKKQQESIGNLV